MNYVISLYSKNAFFECLLPQENNTDHRITVRRDVFGTDKDILLRFEVIDNVWKLNNGSDYSIYVNETYVFSCELQDGRVIRIRTSGGEELIAIVTEEENALHPFEKIILPKDAGISIGRDPGCDICYDFLGLVSRRHAKIYHKDGGLYIDNYSRNGIYVNGDRIAETVRLAFGDYINIVGLHLMCLGEQLAVDTFRRKVKISDRIIRYEKSDDPYTMISGAMMKRFDTWTICRRAPRVYETVDTGAIEIKASPDLSAARKRSELTSLQKQYSGYLAEKKEEAGRRYDDAVRILRETYPEPEQILKRSAEGRIMWNRDVTHSDFLRHRIGSGAIQAPYEIRIPKGSFDPHLSSSDISPAAIKKEYEVLRDVPVTVDLPEHKLIGIIGGCEKAGAIEVARTISLQVAYSNCYTDVKLCYVYNDAVTSDRGQWGFARWLPHVWSTNRETRYIASDPSETEALLYELKRTICSIHETQRGAFSNAGPAGPHFIVMISDPDQPACESFLRFAAERDPSYGLTTIVLAENYDQLPNRCDYIIEKTEDYCGCYGVYGGKSTGQEVVFDSVSADCMEQFARRVSSMRVAGEDAEESLPDSVTFLEMLGAKRPEDLPVRESWTKNRTYDSIHGQIGVISGGKPCLLDAHEKYHGPHGLIAGTTGSGKSETLQTYILSLAVNYSPVDAGFFIIDYKGGGMAGLFSGLPHLYGSVSNLSEHQISRAMISIKSEIRRRQALFNQYGVNNINNYTRLYKGRRADDPVPHLFIVVDEFAELKKEDPEFMKELISVSQLGRSLGIHLILSTQKPAGTVDDNIWSNSRFRICLRVNDKSDSMEMLHRPDASYITQIGRGYLQVGNNEVFEQFQSGYSGAIYNQSKATEAAAVMITDDGRAEVRAHASGRYRNTGEEDPDRCCAGQTELEAVKNHLIEVAEETGMRPAYRLWLPPLSDRICLNEIKVYEEKRFDPDKGWTRASEKGALNAVVGSWDDPANQQQPPFVIDVLNAGNIAVYGSVVTGKSTFLQTLIYSLISLYTPDDVNLYIFDFSSGMLGVFEKAPHVGNILYEEDLEKTDQIFDRILQKMRERRAILKGGSYSQYLQSHDEALPLILIAIDNYAAFRSKTEERYDQIISQISREGPGCGICLAVSGGGPGPDDIPGRLAESMNTVLALSLRDRFSYRETLRAMNIDVMPEAGIKGRGLAKYHGRVLEFQVAEAASAESDYERFERIRTVCSAMDERWTGRKADRIHEIPAHPDWETFRNEELYGSMSKDPGVLPVGYREDAGIYGVPLSTVFCFGIGGHRLSEKTGFIRACILSAADKDAEICIIDDDDRMLADLCDAAGAGYCVSDMEEYDFFKELAGSVKERSARRKELEAEGCAPRDVFRRIASECRPIFIFIADLVSFARSVYSSEIQMSGFLENIISKGSLLNIYFFAILPANKRSAGYDLPLYDSFTAYGTDVNLSISKITVPETDGKHSHL